MCWINNIKAVSHLFMRGSFLVAWVLANVAAADEPPASVNSDAFAEDGIEPTVVAHRDYKDPLIAINRTVFAFNDVSYRYVLIPLSNGYIKVVPEPARERVSNFFYNIKMPIYAVNYILQGSPKRAGKSIARFGINTTIGIFGLFDPAAAWFDLEKQETHFEETLSGYGAGYGVYIVLPFFGPSDLRNGASQIVDYVLNPIPYLVGQPESQLIRTYDYFQDYAPDADKYNELRRNSEDPYIFFRNMYLQGVQRDAED